MIKSRKPRLVFTLGDPAGVGPELLVRSLAHLNTCCRPLLVTQPQLFDRAVTRFHNGPLPDLDLIPVDLPVCSMAGELAAENGAFVVAAIRSAVSSCMQGDAEALITGPISKKAMELAGLPYPGHTEMLREMTGCDRTMMLFSAQGFSVVLHTIHIPLTAVADEVRQDILVDRMRFAWTRYRALTGIAADMRVCGLNPHAGEQGRLGTEDVQISRAVRTLADEEIPVTGPFPADTLFGQVPRNGSVLVYAMYHDQGLIPIKTLDPAGCVNITLGLPFIRASVSHGTAFDIAWQGRADTRNFQATVTKTIGLLGRNP